MNDHADADTSVGTRNDLRAFDELCRELSQNAVDAHEAIQDLADASDDGSDQAHLLAALASIRLAQASMVMIMQIGVHAVAEASERSRSPCG